MEHTHLYQHRVKSIAGGDLRPYFSFSYFGIVSSWHWGVPLLMLLCAAVWFSVIIEQCKTQRPLKIYLSDALNAMVVNLDYIMLILLTTIGLFGIFLNMWNKKIDCICISINSFFPLFLWETNNIIQITTCRHRLFALGENQAETTKNCNDMFAFVSSCV